MSHSSTMQISVKLGNAWTIWTRGESVFTKNSVLFSSVKTEQQKCGCDGVCGLLSGTGRVRVTD